MMKSQAECGRRSGLARWYSGRAVAGERGGVVRELAQHIAGAAAAFHHLPRSAAHQRTAAVFAVGLRGGRHVGLVALRIAHIEVRDPISLRHLDLLVMPLRMVAARSRRRSPRPRPWDRAPQDRPADDQMIGTGRDRGRRRHDPLLVARLGAGRPDARRHQHHAGTDDGAQHRRLPAGADEAVDPMSRACARARRPARGR